MIENQTPEIRSSSSYYLGKLLSPVRTRRSPNNLYVSTQSACNFRKSESISSGYSPTVQSGLRTMKSKGNNDSASRISDFYNKGQINEAISAIDGVNNRISAIDFILKRRVELKEVENQYKISKAAPTILRLNRNFQKRILKNKLNTKGNTFKKILSRLNEDGSIMDPPPASKNDESLIPSKTALNRSQISLDASYNAALPKIQIHKDSISDSVSKNTKPPTLSQIDDKTPAHIKDAQIFHKARHLTFLLGRAKVASPKHLVFGDGNQDSIETWEQVVVNSRSVRHMEEQPKGLRAGGRKKSIDPKIYHLGQKYLENDLYKYLVKHGQRGNNTDIILNDESEPKEKRMKDLEAKVKTKYTKLVKEKVRNSTFFASPSRSNVCSQQDLNAKVFQKELQLHQGLSPTSMGANNKSRRFTSFVTVRKIEIEQEPSQEEERQETLGGFNESFASWTETQLDNLYRENTKIKRKIKDLESELDEERNRYRQKKIQDAKEKKKQELSNNASEIIKAVRKKITY